MTLACVRACACLASVSVPGRSSCCLPSCAAFTVIQASCLCISRLCLVPCCAAVHVFAAAAGAAALSINGGAPVIVPVSRSACLPDVSASVSLDNTDRKKPPCTWTQVSCPEVASHFYCPCTYWSFLTTALIPSFPASSCSLLPCFMRNAVAVAVALPFLCRNSDLRFYCTCSPLRPHRESVSKHLSPFCYHSAINSIRHRAQTAAILQGASIDPAIQDSLASFKVTLRDPVRIIRLPPLFLFLYLFPFISIPLDPPPPWSFQAALAQLHQLHHRCPFSPAPRSSTVIEAVDVDSTYQLSVTFYRLNS